ncbi:hypothetical protein OH77DRAFT_571013 [Trametes cingulata]|nr:hypothetical protein OH77DRAFT_571013 [Trametes cingulata]
MNIEILHISNATRNSEDSRFEEIHGSCKSKRSIRCRPDVLGPLRSFYPSKLSQGSGVHLLSLTLLIFQLAAHKRSSLYRFGGVLHRSTHGQEPVWVFVAESVLNPIWV